MDTGLVIKGWHVSEELRMRKHVIEFLDSVQQTLNDANDKVEPIVVEASHHQKD